MRKLLIRHPEEAARKRAAVSKDGSKLRACGHPSRRSRDFVALALRMTAEQIEPLLRHP
jgi:hypothetical protein